MWWRQLWVSGPAAGSQETHALTSPAHHREEQVVIHAHLQGEGDRPLLTLVLCKVWTTSTWEKAGVKRDILPSPGYKEPGLSAHGASVLAGLSVCV